SSPASAKARPRSARARPLTHPRPLAPDRSCSRLNIERRARRIALHADVDVLDAVHRELIARARRDGDGVGEDDDARVAGEDERAVDEVLLILVAPAPAIVIDGSGWRIPRIFPASLHPRDGEGIGNVRRVEGG